MLLKFAKNELDKSLDCGILRAEDAIVAQLEERGPDDSGQSQ